MMSNTGGYRHQLNPAILIVNEDNEVEQLNGGSMDHQPSYMTITAGQSHNGRPSKISSRSSGHKYTSLRRDHTYESIGNPHVDNVKVKTNTVSKCVLVATVAILLLLLVLAIAILAIAAFTVWYLINEVNEINTKLDVLTAQVKNLTTDSLLNWT